jgi:hypothetical protein
VTTKTTPQVERPVGVHAPLFDPEKDTSPHVTPLDIALGQARKVLESQQDANIHDHTSMIRAAASLYCDLYRLVAALDAEADRDSCTGIMPAAWKAQVAA